MVQSLPSIHKALGWMLCTARENKITVAFQYQSEDWNALWNAKTPSSLFYIPPIKKKKAPSSGALSHGISLSYATFFFLNYNRNPLTKSTNQLMNAEPRWSLQERQACHEGNKDPEPGTDPPSLTMCQLYTVTWPTTSKIILPSKDKQMLCFIRAWLSGRMADVMWPYHPKVSSDVHRHLITLVMKSRGHYQSDRHWVTRTRKTHVIVRSGLQTLLGAQSHQREKQ